MTTDLWKERKTIELTGGSIGLAILALTQRRDHLLGVLAHTREDVEVHSSKVIASRQQVLELEDSVCEITKAIKDFES